MLQTCQRYSASQAPHENLEYRGLYNPASGCPSWARDWDCQLDAEANKGNLPGVFNKVFRPHACELRSWSAERFAQCVAKRRIIMLGDSLMRQQWMSMACMLNNVIVGAPTCCQLLQSTWQWLLHTRHDDSALGVLALKQCTVMLQACLTA